MIKDKIEFEIEATKKLIERLENEIENEEYFPSKMYSWATIEANKRHVKFLEKILKEI